MSAPRKRTRRVHVFVGGRAGGAEAAADAKASPAWTAAAAWAFLEALSGDRSCGRTPALVQMAADAGSERAFAHRLEAVPCDKRAREVAAAIVGEYLAEIRVSATPAVVAEYRLRAASRRARPIYSVRVEEAHPRRPLAFTYHWLLESSPAAVPGRFDGGWRRDSSKCLAANSLAAAFGASPVPAIICPDRAMRRLSSERDGLFDRAFAEGLVWRSYVYTASAGSGHHCFDLGRGEYLSVPEELRLGGIFHPDRLYDTLQEGAVPGLTAIQAVAGVGRAVHGVACRLAWQVARGQWPASFWPPPASFWPAPLWIFGDWRPDNHDGADGRCPDRVRYASAYSGFDVFANSAPYPDGSVEYVFAADPEPKARAVLAHAYARWGLAPGRIFADASTLEADAAHLGRLDMFVFTPECIEFSALQHDIDLARQVAALEQTDKALRYVRKHWPRRVVVENVDDPSVTLPISAMLGEISGYHWVTYSFCPREHAGFPRSRARRYWVGFALDSFDPSGESGLALFRRDPTSVELGSVLW